MSVNRERPKLCKRCGNRFATKFNCLCTACWRESMTLKDDTPPCPDAPLIPAPPRLATWEEGVAS